MIVMALLVWHKKSNDEPGSGEECVNPVWAGEGAPGLSPDTTIVVTDVQVHDSSSIMMTFCISASLFVHLTYHGCHIGLSAEFNDPF